MNAGWSFVYEGFEADEEGLREALCTLGNGYFATRGAAPESESDDVHYPGTYVAGLYNRLTTEVAGRTIENEDLVNVPNWLVLRFRIEDGPWFDAADVELLDHRLELDLRRGQLVRHVEFRDEAGRETAFTQRRLVSIADPHLCALETTFLARNWSGDLLVRSGLDGTVRNGGVARYSELSNDHLEVLRAESEDETLLLLVRTNQSHVHVAQAATTRAFRDGRSADVARDEVVDGGFVAHDLTLRLSEEEPVTVEKAVALHAATDPAISEPLLAARTRVERAGRYDALLLDHALAWRYLWRRFDIELDTDTSTQTIVRLHLFHLLQTVSPNSLDHDVGVPARGWHGEAYRGHIFWDELFVFPVLSLRLPILTRQLLMYRRRRLDEARWAAREAGYEGAMYPWQSGSDGREESQEVHLNPRSGRWVPDNSRLQRHIGVAIAWNVWEYFEVTGDVEFLRHHGAPILIGIARFLASLATYNRGLDRYEIRGVMGPDEYHDAYPDADEPGLDNNAYTNVMTVWVLCRVLDLLERLAPYQRAEIETEHRLEPSEIDRWRDMTFKMYVPFHETPDGASVISQFEGYEDLEEFDWEGYRDRYGDIFRLDRILEAEGDTPNRYKASKQADVLMLFYLFSRHELTELLSRLGHDLGDEALQRNVDYYLQRTSHGSTLSSVVHSWVLARSDGKQTWEFFQRALAADVTDIQGGTTPEGIHLGAMAGSVDLILRCFAGIETRGDVLRFDPELPDELPRARFGLFYRGQRLQVDLTPQHLALESEAGDLPPIQVAVRDDQRTVEPGSSHDFAL